MVENCKNCNNSCKYADDFWCTSYKKKAVFVNEEDVKLMCLTCNKTHQLEMLKDGFEFQKESADLYAKELKRIWDRLDDLIDGFENTDGIDMGDLTNLKNSIPESALLRAK